MRESKIILCKNIKLDKNYNNVINYSENDMLTLCQSQTHLISQKNDYSFIRTNRNTISTNFTYSEALKSNYIAFQNKDYDNKWFFAFVDEVIYKSDSCTEIVYTIDMWSTWFNKLTLNNCFVKREHTNNDSIGANTVDENLDIGDVICESWQGVGFNDRYFIVIESTYIPDDESIGGHDHWSRFNYITANNGLVSGFKRLLFFIDYSNDTSYLSGLRNVFLFITRAQLDEHVEDIHNIYIIPELFIGNLLSLDGHSAYASDTEDSNKRFTYYDDSLSRTAYEININVGKGTTFSDYIPKNNKLFCYPYNYLMVTNNNGNQNIYKYECWYSNNSNAEFNFAGACTCGGSGRVAPKNYKGMTGNDEDESLPSGKYPTFSWTSDAYINWLSQNAVNVISSIAVLGGSIAGAVLTGGASLPLELGAIEMAVNEEQRAMIQGKQNLQNVQSGTSMGSSIASQVGSIIGAFHNAKLLPNIVCGQNTGDVKFSLQAIDFRFKKMRAKTENLKIIDDYFTKYGYKTNRVKTPNVTGRQYFNYIEIGQDSSIGYGEIPQNALEIINSICKKGVTIWHDHSKIGDYSVTNSIVT